MKPSDIVIICEKHGNQKVKGVSDKDGKNGGWVERRVYNVVHSDATIIFVNRDIKMTKGSLGTMNDCIRFNKPYHIVDLREAYHMSELRRFLRVIRPKILNIAGERNLDRKVVSSILERAIRFPNTIDDIIDDERNPFCDICHTYHSDDVPCPPGWWIDYRIK